MFHRLIRSCWSRQQAGCSANRWKGTRRLAFESVEERILLTAISEVEPNNVLGAGQRLPAVIECNVRGSISGTSDVDFYRFYVPAGAKITVNVDGLNPWGTTKDIEIIGYGNSTMDDVAEAVAFLAGPGSSYITGTVINVSGGLYM